VFFRIHDFSIYVYDLGAVLLLPFLGSLTRSDVFLVRITPPRGVCVSLFFKNLYNEPAGVGRPKSCFKTECGGVTDPEHAFTIEIQRRGIVA
jgi:hypothetical protein